jgi:hypothetical protein
MWCCRRMEKMVGPIVWETKKYRVIKKSPCTWWLQHRKLQVMFKVPPAILQTLIDTPNCVLEDRVQYSTVYIPNVLCDGHLQIINCVGIARIHWGFCTVIIRRIETFWSPCITKSQEGEECPIKRRKVNWIGHILRRNCILKHVIEGKIMRTEVAERGGRGRKQLLGDLKKEKKVYWKLKEEALDRILWRSFFRGGYGPVVRQTTE